MRKLTASADRSSDPARSRRPGTRQNIKRMCLVTMLAAVTTSLALADDGGTLSCRTICSKGLPLLPPQTQGTVMRELAGPEFGKRPARDWYGKDGFSAEQVNTAMASMKANITAERENEERQRTTVEVIKTANDVLIWGLETTVGAETGPIGSAVIGVYKFTVDKALDSHMEGVAKARKEALQNIAAKALKDLRAKDQVATDGLLQAANSQDPATAAKAKEELGRRLTSGPLNDIVNSETYKELEPDERIAMMPHVVDVLNQKVNDVVKLSQQSYASLDAELGKQSKRIVLLEKWQQTTEKRVRVLEADVLAVQKSIEAISGKLAEQSEQISLTQDMLLGQMPPKDQLYALKSGFNARLSPSDRTDAIAKLEKVVAVQELHDKARRVINFADDLGEVLARAGILGAADAQNLARNVQTASAATEMLTSIALSGGSPVAIVGAVAGFSRMFGGGGGPSAEMAALARIEGKLNQILDLQRETLRSIQSLSLQLQQSTQALMARLNLIDKSLDLINRKIDYFTETNRQACIRLRESASGDPDFDREAQGWRTYRRRAAFVNDNRFNLGDLNDCFRYLRLVSRPLVDAAPAPHLIDGASVETARQDDTFNARVYRPALNLHEAMLGINGTTTPNCYNRLHAALRGTPSTFSAVRHDAFACDGQDLTLASLKEGGVALFSKAGPPLKSEVILQDAIRLDMIIDGYELTRFVAPFIDLGGQDGRLPANEAELLSSFSRKAEVTDVNDLANQKSVNERNYGELRDVVEHVGAQETMLSGLFLSTRFAALLLATRFGESIATDVTDDQTRAADPYAGTYGAHLALLRERLQAAPSADPNQEPDAKRFERLNQLRAAFYRSDVHAERFNVDCKVLQNWSSRRYQAAMCVAERQPQILRNALTYLVLADLARRADRAGSVESYEAAFKMRNPRYFAKTLPSLAPYATWIDSGEAATPEFPGAKGQWFVRITRTSGEPWMVPLPLPVEVAKARIAYRPQLSSVTKLRAEINNQLDGYRMVRDIFSQPAVSGAKILLVSRSALLNEHAAARSLEKSK